MLVQLVGACHLHLFSKNVTTQRNNMRVLLIALTTTSRIVTTNSLAVLRMSSSAPMPVERRPRTASVLYNNNGDGDECMENKQILNIEEDSSGITSMLETETLLQADQESFDSGSENSTMNKTIDDKSCYILLRVEYQSTRVAPFGGWQRQGKPGENFTPLPSVQSTIEEVASAILKYTTVCVQVAGRTDKGVHSLDQRCALRVPASLENLVDFREKMNGVIVPQGIAILDCKEKSSKRFRVVRKRYQYILQIPKSEIDKRPVKSLHDFSRYQSHSLDLRRLNQALECFVGTHDFRFLSKEAGLVNTTRTIHQAFSSVATRASDLPTFQHLSTPDWENNIATHNFWVLTFESNGFMRHQVRRMVSLALEVGEGNFEVARVIQVMKGETKAPRLAPARGLYMEQLWLANEEIGGVSD